MHSFTIAEGLATDGLWAWAQATEGVDDALRALDAAGAGLVALEADTAWESDGVRALTERIGDLTARVGAAAGRLQVTAWEIARAGS